MLNICVSQVDSNSRMNPTTTTFLKVSPYANFNL